jgi:hypothetical protein
MNDKLSKFLAVIGLTLLVWTWAFLSLEEEQAFSGTLEVSPATDRSFLVTFWVDGKDWGQKIPLELKFKGTPGKITELARRSESVSLDNIPKEQLSYQYNPRDYSHTETRVYPFNLLDFLQKSSKTKGLALTLESCAIDQETTDQIEVHIEVLEKKLLSIECLRETGLSIKEAIAKPAQVEMYVKKSYNGPAYITLSTQQIELAQQQRPVRARPYVEMGTAEPRRAQQEAAVSIPKEAFALQPRVLQPFQKPRSIGYVFSDNLQGKYTAQMDSESESKLRTINLRATDAAFEAYEKRRYPILIEIRDEDVSDLTIDIPPKEIIYNFPPEYVAKQEIELGDPQPPKTAIIELIPVASAPVSP